jgi:hypothetical protein
MNDPILHLASRAVLRKVAISPSSSSALGLASSDIFKIGFGGEVRHFSEETPAAPPSLGERVFGALAEAKIWTSKVAMHLDRASRDRYFRQLDLLHDCDEWFGDEQPLLLNSYKGFIRFMLKDGGGSKPSLAMSPSGRLIAVWQSGSDRLSIEFADSDRAEWVVRRQLGADFERAAGSTTLGRIGANLAPYNPESWLGLE